MNETNPQTDDELIQRAKKRVNAKMGFYVHLLVFVCVNLGLWALQASRGGTGWNVYPLAGWGLGLAIHGLVTFISLSGDGMRDRMLAKEIEHLKGRR